MCVSHVAMYSSSLSVMRPVATSVPKRSEIVTSSRRATASRIVSPVLYSTRTGASAKPSVVTPSAEVSAARTKYPSFSALAGA